MKKDSVKVLERIINYSFSGFNATPSKREAEALQEAIDLMKNYKDIEVKCEDLSDMLCARDAYIDEIRPIVKAVKAVDGVLKNRFVRLANKMGWTEVTADNFAEEAPFGIVDCYETCKTAMVGKLVGLEDAIRKSIQNSFNGGDLDYQGALADAVKRHLTGEKIC